MADLKKTKLARQEGRIRLKLEATWQGRGLRAALYGGKAHIGAIALAQPGEESQELHLQGHREGSLAKACAERLAAALGCQAAIVAGIHFDHITKSEIACVERLSLSLADDLIALINSGGLNADLERP